MTLDLFDQLEDGPHNLLPKDGLVEYLGPVLSSAKADAFFHALLQDIQWQQDQVVVMAKTVTTKRKVAWYADCAYSYTYSGKTKTALQWTQPLLALKSLVEQKTGERFNSCLLNLYHDGSEGMTWHSDAERELKKNGTIASMSLGAVRKFAFKHKQTKETQSIILEHGSLLLMKGQTQQHWLHRLPPTKTVSTPRINLTFRIMNT